MICVCTSLSLCLYASVCVYSVMSMSAGTAVFTEVEPPSSSLRDEQRVNSDSQVVLHHYKQTEDFTVGSRHALHLLLIHTHH